MKKIYYDTQKMYILTEEGYLPADYILDYNKNNAPQLGVYYLDANNNIQVTYDYNLDIESKDLIYFTNNINLDVARSEPINKNKFINDIKMLYPNRLKVESEKTVPITIFNKTYDIPVSDMIILAFLLRNNAIHNYSSTIKWDTGWFAFYSEDFMDAVFSKKTLWALKEIIPELSISTKDEDGDWTFKSAITVTSKDITDFASDENLMKNLLDNIDCCELVIKKLIKLGIFIFDKKYNTEKYKNTPKYNLQCFNINRPIIKIFMLYASLSGYSSYIKNTGNNYLLSITKYSYKPIILTENGEKYEYFRIFDEIYSKKAFNIDINNLDEYRIITSGATQDIEYHKEIQSVYFASMKC